MLLRTLGELSLAGTDFKRGRPLLLLAYLCLEGSQDRRYLAELFWPQSNNALNNLATVLSRLNKVNDTLIDVDGQLISTQLACDANDLIKGFEQEAYDTVLTLYERQFLEGFYLKDLGEELEEWLYNKREQFANIARIALIKIAEQKAREGNFTQAAKESEQAYRQAGAGEPSENALERIYKLLISGDSQLADDVKKEAESFGYMLSQSSEEAQASFASLDHRIAHNLPEQLSSFVGRKKECEDLTSYLAQKEKRLITVVGLGGIGKTRLVSELGYIQLTLEQFSDGVFFVGLDAIKDPLSIPFDIANALGLTLRGELEPLTQLSRQLKEKSLLLILDNYEHLLDAASITTKLLKACPSLKLLVTSRERLNVQGEWVYPLRGLSKVQMLSVEKDTLQNVLQTDTLSQDGIELFYQRAQGVDLSFERSEENQNAIFDICQLVGGSPLAIELAASWVKLLSPSDIAKDIGQNLDLLSSTARDSSAKHKSIEATFEYSWNHLNDSEQAVLRQLSVFIGGFSRDAAFAVATASLPVLAVLVDKSLIRIVDKNRYDLHPLVKHFAASKLTEVKKEEFQSKENHAQYFMQMVLNFDQIFRGRSKDVSEEKLHNQTLVENIENIQTAWRWFTFHHATEDFSAICQTLRLFYGVLLCRFQEGIALFAAAEEELKQVPNVHTPSYASIIIEKAYLLHELGDFGKALNQVQPAIDILKSESKPHLAHFLAYYHISECQRKMGLWNDAKGNAETVLYYSKQLQNSMREAVAQNVHGTIMIALGEYEQAKELFAQTLKYFREFKSPYLVGVTLIHLGKTHFHQKQYKKAKELLSEASEKLEDSNFIQAISRCQDGLARVALEQGDLDEAQHHIEKALNLARTFEARYYEARGLITYGRLAYIQKKPTEAIEHLLKAVQLAHQISAYSTLMCALIFLVDVQVKQDKLDNAYDWLTFVERHEATEFWAKEKARHLLKTIETSVTSNTKQSSNILIENLTLDILVSELIANVKDKINQP